MSKRIAGATSARARDVNDYLARVPKESRATLEKLRKTIKAVVPDAVEVISYQIPTYKYHGRPLVALAAFKSHSSFYVMSTSVMDAYKDELRSYDTAKGTIRFPAGKSLPAALVKRLVNARIDENETGVRAARSR